MRILLFADTHLGFDLPQRPRVERRRRGHDFFANYELILRAAVEERVDLVVHGGDLFFRSRVPIALVQQAFIPLKRLAEQGIPVYLVPGNHERSKIPYDMLALHPGIHIFDRPRTYTFDVRGVRLALTGFPYHRVDVRSAFVDLLAAAGWTDVSVVDVAPPDLFCSAVFAEGEIIVPVDDEDEDEDDEGRDGPPGVSVELIVETGEEEAARDPRENGSHSEDDDAEHGDDPALGNLPLVTGGHEAGQELRRAQERQPDARTGRGGLRV